MTLQQSVVDLLYGFGVALQPTNLLWSVVGVLVGNLVGVLPGMGVLSTLSILLPLTYTLAPVPAILMLAGIFYGSQYGGAIGAILLNLPSHPPHAITCLDGYPLTRRGKGGTALGITMVSSFFAASVGILIMIFLSPILVEVAFKFGPTEICAIMLLGLLAGATMARGNPLKGIATTFVGLVAGAVGTDTLSGGERFTFGIPDLADGVELTALSMGLFGIADFLINVNRTSIPRIDAAVRMRDMWPSLGEMRESFWPMVRGTSIGVAFGAMPGTGPTITTFIAYALEQKISKTPERYGTGMIGGVAAPEAAAHAKTQVDFIPTMSLGIPGDAVMALILGALIIKGIQPGPQLITEHPDVFWGLVASFWIGNVLLMVLNIPLIGVWVRMLRIPYRYLFPTAMFFITIGVYAARNSLFDVFEVLAFGVVGAVLLLLEFPLSPVVLGFVLGPMLEENFRRAMVQSHGNLAIFVDRPISATVLSACVILVAFRTLALVRRSRLASMRVAPVE